MAEVEFDIHARVQQAEAELARLGREMESLRQKAKRTSTELAGVTVAGAQAVAAAEVYGPPRPRMRDGRVVDYSHYPDRRPPFDRLSTEDQQRHREAIWGPGGGRFTPGASGGAAGMTTATGVSLGLGLDDLRDEARERINARMEQYWAERDARDEARRQRRAATGDLGEAYGPPRPPGFVPPDRDWRAENREWLESQRHGGGGGGGGIDLDGLGDNSRRARGDIDGLALSLGLMAPVALAASAAVVSYTQAAEAQRESALETAKRAEDREATYRVSTGKGFGSKDEIMPDVFRLAFKRAITTDEAFQLLDTSVRSGMTADAATGGGADALAKVRAALNATASHKGAVDADKLAKAVGGTLYAMDKPFDEANIEWLGRQLRGAYAGQMELTDLLQLSPELKGLGKVGVSPGESIAAFGALVDTAMPGAEAATAVRNTVERLRIAGGTKYKRDALAQMGLKPSDIDLDGEDLLTALDRLDKATEKMPGAKRSTLMSKLFGTKVASRAEILMSDGVRERMRKYLAADEGPGSLDKYADAEASGLGAAGRRSDVRDEAIAYDRRPEALSEMKMDKAKQLLKERGWSDWVAETRYWLYGAPAYNLNRMFGEEYASDAAVRGMLGDYSQDPTEGWSRSTDVVKKRLAADMGRPAQTAEEAAELLREIAKHQRKMVELLEEGNSGKRKPRSWSGGSADE